MRKALFCVLTAFLLAGCVSTRYVPVETVRTEYKSITDTVVKIDSFKTEKTTVIREANENDSIMLAQMGFKLRANERLLIMMQNQLDEIKSSRKDVKNDTVIVGDTIRVPYPVEKQLTFFQRLAIDWFSYILIGCVLIFILLFIRAKLKG